MDRQGSRRRLTPEFVAVVVKNDLARMFEANHVSGAVTEWATVRVGSSFGGEAAVGLAANLHAVVAPTWDPEPLPTVSVANGAIGNGEVPALPPARVALTGNSAPKSVLGQRALQYLSDHPGGQTIADICDGLKLRGKDRTRVSDLLRKRTQHGSVVPVGRDLPRRFALGTDTSIGTPGPRTVIVKGKRKRARPTTVNRGITAIVVPYVQAHPGRTAQQISEAIGQPQKSVYNNLFAQTRGGNPHGIFKLEGHWYAREAAAAS